MKTVRFLFLFSLLLAICGYIPAVVEAQTAPFGRPLELNDEYGTARIPIEVYSDASTEEYVPDITDPNSMRLGIFRACGTYTVMLYMYDKNLERITNFSLIAVNKHERTVSVRDQIWNEPKLYTLESAPERIRHSLARVDSILTKSISHPTQRQLANWIATEGTCSTSTSRSPAAVAAKPSQTDVRKPVLIASVPPEFSEEARAKKIGGEVTVGFVIDTQGQPQNLHVIKGLGHGLDEQALLAVKQYRFKPATKNGQPVDVDMQVVVKFEVF